MNLILFEEFYLSLLTYILNSLRIECVVIVETVFNLPIRVHELTFSILLVLLPHSDIIISRRINVPTVAMLLLRLELAFIEMAVLGQMTADTFPLILRIQLSDIGSIFNFKFSVVQLGIEVNRIILLDFKQINRS